MVNIYTPEQCQHYASFMYKLRRIEAEALYWICFLLVLSLLFAASFRYGRVMENIEPMKAGDRERQRLIRNCFWYCLASGFVALCIGILEAFALLTLQFCDGEPLSSLYWSTWIVLQVGGIVAIFGISLHIRHMIKGRRHPPWALALGTPVLVVAGLGHYVQGKIKRSAKNIKTRSRSRSRGRRSSGGRDLSEAPTARDENTDIESQAGQGNERDSRTIFEDSSANHARIIGFTKDGDVILRLSRDLQAEISSKIRNQTSITWVESARTDDDDCTLGEDVNRQSSLSNLSKGKEKEPYVIQDNGGNNREPRLQEKDHNESSDASVVETYDRMIARMTNGSREEPRRGRAPRQS